MSNLEWKKISQVEVVSDENCLSFIDNDNINDYPIHYLDMYTPIRDRSWNDISNFDQNIVNLKKSKGCNEGEKYYQGKAFQFFSKYLKIFFKNLNDGYVLVPGVTSKRKADSDYINRSIEVIKCAELEDRTIDCLDIKETVESMHGGTGGTRNNEKEDSFRKRLTFVEDEKRKLTSLLSRNKYSTIYIFDDVITTGLHYKAQSDFLKEQMEISDIKDIKIEGIFFGLTKNDNNSKFIVVEGFEDFT